jgi:formylmethanofuran dehydrogenase subunit A
MVAPIKNGIKRSIHAAKLPDKVKGRITLPEVDREYTLYEIAISMSAGPARALGLTHKGNLGISSDADVVMYEEDANIQRMFGHPRYVIKGGEIVIEDGEIREAPGASGGVVPGLGGVATEREFDRIAHAAG